jgi:hypothetical protein
MLVMRRQGLPAAERHLVGGNVPQQVGILLSLRVVSLRPVLTSHGKRPGGHRQSRRTYYSRWPSSSAPASCVLLGHGTLGFHAGPEKRSATARAVWLAAMAKSGPPKLACQLYLLEVDCRNDNETDTKTDTE